MSSRSDQPKAGQDRSSGWPPEEGKAHHDLKQPLNIIILAVGNARHCLGNELTAEQVARISGKLDTIEAQVDRLSHLIDAMATGEKLRV